MIELGFILICAAFALVAAWFANFLVGLLRGEHPSDTGRIWWEVLLGMFAVGQLGLLGRALNYCNGSWARRLLTTLGGVVLVITIFRACRGG